jgi:hypothetical protein
MNEAPQKAKAPNISCRGNARLAAGGIQGPKVRDKPKYEFNTKENERTQYE